MSPLPAFTRSHDALAEQGQLEKVIPALKWDGALGPHHTHYTFLQKEIQKRQTDLRPEEKNPKCSHSHTESLWQREHLAALNIWGISLLLNTNTLDPISKNRAQALKNQSARKKF